MSELRGRGVRFEEYDEPDLRTVDGIAATPVGQAAWFKDSEGNTLTIRPAGLSATIGRCPPQPRSTVTSRTGSPSTAAPRSALPGDRDADVCIVGAGYTGLWTAYYLKRADPRCASWCWRRGSPVSARRAATVAGCRGWCPATATRWPASTAATAWWPGSARSTRPSTRSSTSPRGEGIDAGIVKGGTLRDRPQPRAGVSRLAAEFEEERSWEVDGIARADDSRSGPTHSVRRRGVGLPHAALRADPACPAGARPGRRRRAARRADLRAVAGHRDHVGPRGHARRAP